MPRAARIHMINSHYRLGLRIALLATRPEAVKWTVLAIIWSVACLFGIVLG